MPNQNSAPLAPAPLDRTATIAEWHGYIASAPNFVTAQNAMEQALMAGVDFFALESYQRSLTATNPTV